MTRIVFAIPGDLNALTGGYGYDRRILQALPACGCEVLHCALPGSFPNTGEEGIGAAIATINRSLQPGNAALIDGMACGVLPPMAISAMRAPVLALCHHPLGLETGLTPEARKRLIDSERHALARAAHVIVTSFSTREILAHDFGVPESKISVAIPGTDRAPRAVGSRRPAALLAVGSIIPRKGFDVLAGALAGLAGFDWHLRIVGSTTRSPETFAALNGTIQSHGLHHRITCVGELPPAELASEFHRSDIFVSSSLYEGYGMALAEALSHGLPIITATGGAAAVTVPDAAALKVPPGDAAALRAALQKLILDQNLRLRLADAAWLAGQALPSWHDAAMVISEAARKVMGASDQFA